MGQGNQPEPVDVVFTPTKAVRLQSARGQYLALTLPPDQGGEASCFDDQKSVEGASLFEFIERLVSEGTPFPAKVIRKGQNKRVNGPYQNIIGVEGFVPADGGESIVQETHGQPLGPRTDPPAPAAPAPGPAARPEVARMAGIPDGAMQYVFHMSEASLRAQVYAATAELAKVGLVTAEKHQFEKALKAGMDFVREGKSPLTGEPL